MPQKLSADWSHISPEEHEEYLHTLGNLSVTGYNSELSNIRFAGFGISPNNITCTEPTHTYEFFIVRFSKLNGT